MKYIIALMFLCLSIVQSVSQGHYLVELDKFTPPQQEMIRHLRGFPAEAFLAKDMDGTEHFLHDYRGQVTVLFFYSVEDHLSFDWLKQLNKLQIKYLDGLNVFAFAKEERSVIASAIRNEAIVFPNFPNGTLFGEMAYEGDLGMGRMIVIDKNGIIAEVLPRSYFADGDLLSTYAHVDGLFSQVINRE